MENYKKNLSNMKSLNRAPSVCSITSDTSRNIITTKRSRASIQCCNPEPDTANMGNKTDRKNSLGCLKIKQKRIKEKIELDKLDSCFINIMATNDYKVKQDSPRPSEHQEKRFIPKMIEIKLDDCCVNPFLQRHLKCLYMPKSSFSKNKTRGTQTLYRESSMQTLPYLPDISNDKETLKTLELFKLPNILKGDGPPGLREVEILERARKRWALEKAMKNKFQYSMKMARSEYARNRLKRQHKTILEAFEWENWLEREERIQACQMLRFQLVLRIFHKREQEMYKNSNKRIQLRCEQALEKRNRDLKKNEIEFGRKMRRLRIEHEKRPRNWRNEKISVQLRDPSSEFYAPQMRYGVNPNRRHFELSRKAFEMRMEDLEKRSVNMSNLECPFAKLKEWSKPKVQQMEVEQNFCSDANLQKVYESLKGLREQSKKQKTVPRCLVEKIQRHSAVKEEEQSIVEQKEEEDDDEIVIEQKESPIEETVVETLKLKRTYSHNSVVEMFPQSNDKKLSVSELLEERHHEELEIMLADYEGSTIGWLIRFLSEEMKRLEEQRKLHFLSMLAQKERWRREASEAGLRQKENEMRNIYEEMFEETENANIEVCEQYLNNIFGIDTQEQADSEAITTVTELAKVIDADLQRWIVSFHPIQNPLNYDNLRCLLRDLVFPDELADCLRRKYEADVIVDQIVKDMVEKIIASMDTFDICAPIANEFVDRLIDNDLYLFSSECSSCCECEVPCDCNPPELEAAAIVRKLIRYSVPGRRWRTSTERIADENVKDIIDDVVEISDSIHQRLYVPGEKRKQPTVSRVVPQMDLRRFSSDEHLVPTNSTSLSSVTQKVTVICYKPPRSNQEDISKRLTRSEELLWVDSSRKSSSESLESIKDLSATLEVDRESMKPSSLKATKSAYDIMHPETRLAINTETSTEESYINAKSREIEAHHISRLTEAALITKDFVGAILNEVIKEIEPTNIESDTSISAPELETSLSYTVSSHQSEREKSAEVFTISTEEEKAIQIAKSKQRMVMTDAELKKILEDDDDECKCQKEIDYKNEIKVLYENDQISVIFMDKSIFENTDELLEPPEFEYCSNGFEIESSFNEDGLETAGAPGAEGSIEKTSQQVTFEDVPITNEQIDGEPEHVQKEEVAEEQEVPQAAEEKTVPQAAEEKTVPQAAEEQEVPKAAEEQQVTQATEGQEAAQATEAQEAAQATEEPKSQLPEAQEIPQAQASEAQEIPEAQASEAQEIPQAQDSEAQEIPQAQAAEGQEIPQVQASERQEIPQPSEAQEVPQVQPSEGQEIPQPSEGQEIPQKQPSDVEDLQPIANEQHLKKHKK